MTNLKHFYFLFFSIVLIATSSLSQTEIDPLSPKKIAVSIKWNGDFAGFYDFNGGFNKLIKGEANKIETEKNGGFKNPENCEVSAHFSEVSTQFTQKNEPAYKLYFRFICQDNSKNRTTQTAAFFVRRDTLEAHTNTVHLSEKTRTTQFFVKSFSQK